MPAEKDKNAPAEQNALLNAVSIASYPVSGVIGYKVAEAQIRDEAVKNLSHDGLLKELQRKREETGGRLVQEINSPHSRPMGVISRELEQVEKSFYEGRAALFEKMGVKTTREHWSHLRSSEKFNAIIQGATVASIIIGATILVTQSKHLFSGLLGESDDQSPPR